MNRWVKVRYGQGPYEWPLMSGDFGVEVDSRTPLLVSFPDGHTEYGRVLGDRPIPKLLIQFHGVELAVLWSSVLVDGLGVKFLSPKHKP